MDMNSNQSAPKRDSTHVDRDQNQNTTGNDNEGGENSESKRMKQEIHPLNMENILEKVFSYLEANWIMTVRHVNPLWNKEGAKALLNKCFLQIPSTLRNQRASSNSREMNEFKAFLALKSSKAVMIPNITITSVGDMELWGSLGALGPQVTGLKLDLVEDKGEMLHNLLHLLPNLKYIRFKELQPSEFDQVYHAIIVILTVTMSQVDSNRAPLTVSTIILNFDTEEELGLFSEFANCKNIKIEDLHLTVSPSARDIPEFETRFVNIMSKLLSTNKDVLQQLSFKYCEEYLYLLDFPCLTELTNMNLILQEVSSGLGHYGFSPSFQFSDKVPHLYEIYISCEGRNSSSFFFLLFQHTRTATSVRRLQYSDSFHNFDIEPLFQTFPYVEDFTASVDENSWRRLAGLWTIGRNLKKLDITISLSTYPPGAVARVADLDFIFTGFDPKTVEGIKKYPMLAPCSADHVERLRVNPSLLNLTQLQVLTIAFEGNARAFRQKNILAIAGAYGFQFMPNDSRVFIDVENVGPSYMGFVSALDNVSEQSNVTIVHSRLDE